MTKSKERRSDMFYIPTDQIEIEDKLNGRWMPIAQEAIEKMANSILKNGQLQPVELRKDRKTGKYKVVLGYTRVKAIKWGNESGLFSPPLEVKALKTTINDEISFIHNLDENLTRNSTTPMDDAFNQQRLREQYGWKDREIAELYQCTPGKISQYKLLLELPRSEQERVHNGTMTVASARMIVQSGISEDEIPTLVSSCMKENGKVDSTLIKDTLRNFALEESGEDIDEDLVEEETEEMEDLFDRPKQAARKTKEEVKEKEEEDPPRKKTTPPRTMKQVREFWEEQTGVIDPSTAIGKFAKSLVKFLNGSIKDETMQKAFDKLYDEIKEEIKGDS